MLKRILISFFGPDRQDYSDLQADLFGIHEEARARSARKVAEMRLTREAVQEEWHRQVVLLRRPA